ncbi:MAG: hypothetical protein MGU50_13020 [Trichodesmium sp. MAG_R02]|nr:hypothetical protein [Trichodesmium sp. MAG_R02]
MRTTCPVFPPVCYAAKRNPWFAQNIHATNFLCSIELICLICWLKIVMIIHVSFCTTCRKCEMWATINGYFNKFTLRGCCLY